jgi:hypothetical protein
MHVTDKQIFKLWFLSLGNPPICRNFNVTSFFFRDHLAPQKVHGLSARERMETLDQIFSFAVLLSMFHSSPLKRSAHRLQLD